MEREPVVHVGLATAVSGPDGASVRCSGLARLDPSTPVTPDSCFEWGSITKTVTGTLLALLAAERLVRLDQPLGELLPGAPALALADLASHTSGLPRLLPSTLRWTLRHRALLSGDPYAAQDEAAVLADLRRTRVRSPTVRYSNYGAGLLGLALTKASAMTYDELVRTHVAGPLGLSSLTTADDPCLVDGHDRKGRPTAHWHFPDALAGCGALRGTVGDLARWVQAVGGDAPEPLRTALRTAVAGRARSRRAEVGLGWHRSVPGLPAMRAPRPGEPAWVWHNGGTGGFASFAAFDERTGSSVAVLSNSSRPVDGLGHNLLRDLAG